MEVATGKRPSEDEAVSDLWPLRFLLLAFAGFVNREQARVIAYLVEENRVLR